MDAPSTSPTAVKRVIEAGKAVALARIARELLASIQPYIRHEVERKQIIAAQVILTRLTSEVPENLTRRRILHDDEEASMVEVHAVRRDDDEPVLLEDEHVIEETSDAAFAQTVGHAILEEVAHLREEVAHLRKQRDSLQHFSSRQVQQIRKLTWSEEDWATYIREHGDPFK